MGYKQQIGKLEIDRTNKRRKSRRRSSMEIEGKNRDSPATVKLDSQQSSDQRTMTLNQFSSVDSSEKSDNSFPRHCRICYAGEHIQSSEPSRDNTHISNESSDGRDLSGRSLREP